MSFISEFKAFILRGNAVDLAVAVVIGAAFNKVISAFVDGLVMPFLGLILGGADLSERTATIHKVVFKWGVFVQSLIDFVLMALVIFIVIKMINTLSQKVARTEISPEIKVLREIRDQLQQKG